MLWNMQSCVVLTGALVIGAVCAPVRGQVLPGPGTKARELLNRPSAPAGRVANLRSADFGIWFRPQSGGGRGSLVADVAEGSVFARAGIREGDSIISINGEPMKTETRLAELLTTAAPAGQPFNIIFVRDGQELSATLLPSAVIESVAVVDPLYQVGLVLDPRVPTRLVIERVYPRTPAYYAGLRAGDVITSLNNIPLQ